MEKCNNDDILLYLDCGCEINIHKKQSFIEYFNLNDLDEFY